MKIYLAGSVPKGDTEAKQYIDWRKEYSNIISKYVEKVELFDPNIFYKLEGDSAAVTGADCMCIQDSDLIVVNAEEKLGAGTAMELVIAKYLKKPVITVLPKNSHHRRSNLTFEGNHVKEWIHPFIETFSDVIIENIHEIESALEKISKNNIKNISEIDSAILYAKKILKQE